MHSTVFSASSRATAIAAFENGTCSYIDQLPPEMAVQLDVYQVLEIFHKKFGTAALQSALDHNQSVASPLASQTNTEWMKTTKMVGVNVRTIGGFFNVVKYALTLPAFHSSIHLLPIWEPGVVGSLYGMVSWNLNPEFFSHDLYRAIPALNTVEKQFKVCVNLLHLLGKAVGMDVIPHTDRFSEMALLNPKFFEWVVQKDGEILDHSSSVFQKVEDVVYEFLKEYNTANGKGLTVSKEAFFDIENADLAEEQRLEMLFGYKDQYELRLKRRLMLMQSCLEAGLETLPMTMAPPYRGLHIDKNDFVTDANGHQWYTYVFDKPQSMSRVFGPLTRYKFFETNADWSLDFEQPAHQLWGYLAQKFATIQAEYQIDFMRGDMSHVQPRPDGVPSVIDTYYDPLGYIKEQICQKVPYFAYFAESFLPEPDTMGYGIEEDHLEATLADTTLGDLQSCPVDSTEFKNNIIKYFKIGQSRSFKPCFTVLTADKDDPRFDAFFAQGNIFRYFVATFCSEFPSYYSLGFEQRDQNLVRNKNETYTKLYVFKIEDDAETDKVTHGPFTWGQNEAHFIELLKIRQLAEKMDLMTGVQWIADPGNDWWIWQRGNHVFAAQMKPNTPMPQISGQKIYEYAADGHACMVFLQS